jgi:hypothetical protein
MRSFLVSAKMALCAIIGTGFCFTGFAANINLIVVDSLTSTAKYVKDGTHYSSLVLTDGGAVAVGTTSPWGTFDVLGADEAAVNIRNSTNSKYGLTLSACSTFAKINTNWSTGGHRTPLSLGTHWNQFGQLYLDTMDRIGIGTTSPQALFHVNHSGDNTSAFMLGDWTTPSYNTGIYLRSTGKPVIRTGSDATFGIYNHPNDNQGITIYGSEGWVGIGDTTPSYMLDVAGTVRAAKIISDDTVICDVVKINNWKIEAPDYVFNRNYALPKLENVEKFIKEKKHLPDVPSARQMKTDGVDVAKMNMVLLKKVEELTLYVIEQNKKIEALEKKVQGSVE